MTYRWRTVCLIAGSKRCNEMRPHLEAIANGDLWGKRFIFAESDISDSRGYTSYLDRYGVLKLPTIVLFRNGHPTMYPLESPLTQEGVEAWLATATPSEPLPRGVSDDAESVRMQDAQAQAMERIRQHQQEAKKQQEEESVQLQQGITSGSSDAEDEADGKGAAGGAEDSDSAPADDPADASAVDEGGRNLQAIDACDELVGESLTDANFEKVVMDKANDVFVLFYEPSTEFCNGNGTAYAKFAGMMTESWPRVTAAHMDVRVHKSPFVFEPDELPVVMLFPSEDKRPLEYDKKLEDTGALVTFASEHAKTMKQAAPPPKGEL
jgi:thioredoxin-like negative regulator of GroEL